MHPKFFLKHPGRILPALFVKYFGWLPDKPYLRILFLLRTGKILYLNNPKTFNEKLQWLKLYNRRPEYSVMVDKYAVKEYVSNVIGKEYVIPTLGVWDKPEDIEWNILPNQFVLKTTHGGGGGGVYICKDKSSVNQEEVVRMLNKSLKQNLYKEFREWPYKDVKPRIIAEQFMKDDGKHSNTIDACVMEELHDYKFFCFNGKIEFYKIDFDRFVKHRANYYNRDGSLLPFGEGAYPRDPNKKLTIPSSIPQMIHLAEKLSQGHPFMRVDFYNCKGNIYFGEITFFPAGGFGEITPEIYNSKIGDLLELDNII